MSDPMVSSHCFDLAVLAFVLAVLLLAAIVGLSIHIRHALLGARLMRACGNDYQSAALAIENVRAENELLGEAISRGLRSDYKLRLARFNEDTQ